jgi:hypothetical protein
LSKFDLKNSKKFQDRVKKLEGNQYTKLINDPVEFVDPHGNTWYVAAIGINDAYLIVYLSDKGYIAQSHVDGEEPIVLRAEWTKSDGFQKSTQMHENVSQVMLNWLMLTANESSFRKVKHTDVRIGDEALRVAAVKGGDDYVQAIGEKYVACYQGILRHDIHNPLFKK